MLFESRDYDRAIAQAMKTLELNPSADFALIWLAFSYQQVGKSAEALAALDKAPVPRRVQHARAELLALSGDRAAAQLLLTEIEKRFAVEHVPRGALARAHFALGEKERAFEWLKRGIEERDQTVLSLKVSPIWDPLRSDPRYHQLLRRMNLE
jgi:serine/threonine-protein kinase